MLHASLAEMMASSSAGTGPPDWARYGAAKFRAKFRQWTARKTLDWFVRRTWSYGAAEIMQDDHQSATNHKAMLERPDCQFQLLKSQRCLFHFQGDQINVDLLYEPLLIRTQYLISAKMPANMPDIQTSELLVHIRCRKAVPLTSTRNWSHWRPRRKFRSLIAKLLSS